MNVFSELLSYPLTLRVGWTLFHSIWQGAIAAALFAVLRIGLRQRSANARYLAGCFMLLLVAAAPILTFYIAEPADVSSSELNRKLLRASYENVLTELSHLLPPFALAGGPATTMQSVLKSIEQSFPLLVVAWTMGVLLFSLRLLQGCLRLKALRVKATEPLDPSWIEMLDDLRCRLNISRPVQILKSAFVEVPTVLGWLRPLILLPAGSMLGLTPVQLEAILAHELAHVTRNDYLINAFQLVVETLMFYHPAVWWISRSIREEREHCCDDLVIQAGSDRREYARALASLEEMRPASPQLAFAANGGPLLRRIRRLAGVTANDRPVSVRELSGLALLVIGFSLIITGGYLLAGQPKYQAVARMKLDWDNSLQLSSTDGKVALSIGDPYFLQTEFHILQSENVLGPVVKDLGLDQEWGRRYGKGARLKFEETISLLKSRLRLNAVRNTSLIEIHVVSDQPAEAATIANAIAETYKTYRQEQRRQASPAGIVKLEERFRKQEQEIAEAQNKVNELRETLRIPDAIASMDTPALMTAETVRKLEGLRIENRKDLIQQEQMLELLKHLSHEDLVQTIPTAIPDGQLNFLMESLARAEQLLASKKNEFGPETSEILALNSQITDLNKKIHARVDGILSALNFKVGALKAGLAALENDLQAATANDMVKARQSQPYFDAKHRLEQLQRFNQMLNLKIAAEKSDSAMPRTALMELVDRALASRLRMAPNRYRGASCLLLGGLLSVTGFAMLRMASRPTHTGSTLPPV